MNNEELRQQLVELLIKAHVTMGTHSVADYLIANNVTIPATAEWVNKDGWFVCSKCDKTCPYDTEDDTMLYWECKFCPSCGSQMNKENADE